MLVRLPVKASKPVASTRISRGWWVEEVRTPEGVTASIGVCRVSTSRTFDWLKTS
jgi:hypothetical protein